MNAIDQEVKNLPEPEFPEGLHGKIMERIAFLRFRTPFVIITSLLILNLVVSGWRIWLRIGDNDGFMVIKALLDGFEFSADYFNDFFNTIYNTLPLWALGVFIINAFLTVYVIYVSRYLKKLSSFKDQKAF